MPGNLEFLKTNDFLQLTISFRLHLSNELISGSKNKSEAAKKAVANLE